MGRGRQSGPEHTDDGAPEVRLVLSKHGEGLRRGGGGTKRESGQGQRQGNSLAHATQGLDGRLVIQRSGRLVKVTAGLGPAHATQGGTGGWWWGGVRGRERLGVQALRPARRRIAVGRRGRESSHATVRRRTVEVSIGGVDGLRGKLVGGGPLGAGGDKKYGLGDRGCRRAAGRGGPGAVGCWRCGAGRMIGSFSATASRCSSCTTRGWSVKTAAPSR